MAHQRIRNTVILTSKGREEVKIFFKNKKISIDEETLKLTDIRKCMKTNSDDLPSGQTIKNIINGIPCDAGMIEKFLKGCNLPFSPEYFQEKQKEKKSHSSQVKKIKQISKSQKNISSCTKHSKNSSVRYSVGSLPIGSLHYVKRQSPNSKITIEQKCLKTLNSEGSLLRIRGAKFAGKTSLINYLKGVKSEQNIPFLYLSFDKDININQIENIDELLFWICTEICQYMGIASPNKEKWDSSLYEHVKKCSNQFRYKILPYVKSPFILALDDVDLLLREERFSDFFRFIHQWHEKSKSFNDKTSGQLRTIIGHSTDIYTSLVCQESPFNIGERIVLSGFTIEEVKRLSLSYNLSLNDSEAMALIKKLGGHPYLTQEAVKACIDQQISIAKFITLDLVNHEIYKSYLHHLEILIEQQESLTQSLKKIALSDQAVHLDLESRHYLESLGLISVKNGYATFCCELYQIFFSAIICK